MATEEDFFNFFNSLAPSDQRKFLGSFGTTQPNLDDQSYYQEDPYSTGDPYLTQSALAPQMDMTSMMLGQMAGGSYPQYTSSGKLDPLDLSQLAQRLNYTQDLGGSMFDNAVALFAGPDAWGSQEQFQPVVNYTGKATPASYDDQGNPTPVTKSGQMLQIAKQSGGARGFLADLIDQGIDPDSAVAALREIVTNSVNATNLTPDQRKQASEIRRTLDVWRSTDPLTGEVKSVDRNTAPWESFDEESLRKTAQDMFEQKLGDQMDASTLVYNPQDGNFYQGRDEKPSPAMQKFQNAGLPLPTETYTDPKRMNALTEALDPGYQANDARYAQQAQQRDDDLAAEFQKNLKAQLDLQSYDQQLRQHDQPTLQPRGSKNRADRPQLPPGFSFATQPNAPTLQGTMPNGTPAVQMPRTVQDSFGRNRTVTPQHFDFGPTHQIFPGANPGGQGVRTDQRTPIRQNPQAQRQANLQAQQRWNDQYNQNYAATRNRQSTPSETQADFAAGMARARAQVSTPLQDVMLARLMSLRSRAGI